MLNVNFFLVALTSFFVSLMITPFFTQLGKKQNFVDRPGYRKIHTNDVPHLGGVVIFFGFLMSTILFIPIEGAMRGLLAGSIIVLLLGVVDDIVDLKPYHKFLIQLMPAFFFIIFYVEDIQRFIAGPGSFLGVIAYFIYPILLFWIVGVTNAINLIDGLDGLACGVSVISLATFFILALFAGSAFEPYHLLITALIGSMLAFLRYNFFPAQIFLGDSGATFAGYLTACLGVLWVISTGNILFINIPLVILALPVGDTLFAIWRRYRNHTPIFQADQGHLHHRLLKKGFSHRNVVLILYGLNGACCVVALALALAFL
ncbi:MAG: undecaprenyl/decaprenyl-phosphate alpha-N-acetylglucosaminyl 1-phosphate transferase [Candidatus Aminicenantes bacterium]|nr:undecaprenyl/decaprenyl-phosphate alpha-N-acetylglucosaminyl 1-phosphate transferase [Candidatus Aminicenantes bacterium]